MEADTDSSSSWCLRHQLNGARGSEKYVTPCASVPALLERGPNFIGLVAEEFEKGREKKGIESSNRSMPAITQL